MPSISDCSVAQLCNVLSTTGLYLTTGPISYHIKSGLTEVAQGLSVLYGDYPLVCEREFSDFHISVDPTSWIRGKIRPKVQFKIDDVSPFMPMPRAQAFAFLEWGMNWCVASYPNQFVKLHAAVLEKGGRAVILPGAPGAGKSTLSAALLLRGWRLLSDEHALVCLDKPSVIPVCRPVSLKNESISIIRDFEHTAVIGPVTENTHKGTVAHLKADLFPDSFASESVPCKWIIFPHYQRGREASLVPKQKPQTMIFTSEQSFNYSILGEAGYKAMVNLVDACDCYDFAYSNLTEAVALFDQLSSEQSEAVKYG